MMIMEGSKMSTTEYDLKAICILPMTHPIKWKLDYPATQNSAQKCRQPHASVQMPPRLVYDVNIGFISNFPGVSLHSRENIVGMTNIDSHQLANKMPSMNGHYGSRFQGVCFFFIDVRYNHKIWYIHLQIVWNSFNRFYCKSSFWWAGHKKRSAVM